MGEAIVPRRGVGEKVILLHCVCVGELNSVGTLVKRLLAAGVDQFTTNTPIALAAILNS